MISFATWLCTVCAFAFGDLFGGVQSNSWQFAMYIIQHALDVTLLRMGSDERRSVLRRRLFRHGRSGTPTSSPEEADFSDEEPIDDHAAEQMMLQAVRLANPDMDDAALIESI